jgi:amidase
LMTTEPKPSKASGGGGGRDPNGAVTGLGSSLTNTGSSLQWPALSVPAGYVGPGLPVGLQILGRAWEEARIISYAYAYEQATHHRRPPPTVPPLSP